MQTTPERRAAAARDSAVVRALRGAARRSKAPAAEETAERLADAGLSGEALNRALAAAERIRAAAAADESLFGNAAERVALDEAAALVDTLPGPAEIAAERDRARAAENEADFDPAEAERIVDRAMRSGHTHGGADSRSRAASAGIRP